MNGDISSLIIFLGNIMVRTFDFIFHLKKDKDMQNEYIKIMQSNQDYELDYKGWHLFFDNSRKYVVVTSNNKDERLDIKFVPAEMSYETLYFMMNNDNIPVDYNIDVKWLDF